MNFCLTYLFMLLSFASRIPDEKIELLSQQGKECSIHISYLIPNNTLKIATVNDNIFIDGVYGIDSVKKCGDKLAMIFYHPRIGTGVSRRRCIIISVDGDKLIEVFHITTFGSSDFDTTYDEETDKLKLWDEHERFTCDISCSPDSLVLICTENTRSKFYKTSSSINARYTMPYSKENNVFQEAEQNYDLHLKYYDVDSNQYKDVHLQGMYPFFNMYNGEYVYYNGAWCSLYHGYLSQYSRRK